MEELFKRYYAEPDVIKKLHIVVEIQQYAFDELVQYAYVILNNGGFEPSEAEIEAEMAVSDYYDEMLEKHLLWFYTYRPHLESNAMAFFKRGVKYRALKALRKRYGQFRKDIEDVDPGETESTKNVEDKIDYESIITALNNPDSPMYALPDKPKDAFKMRYVDEYSDEEIAEVQNNSKRTVQVYICNVLALYKKLYSSEKKKS